MSAPSREEMDACFAKFAETYDEEVPFMQHFAQRAVARLPPIIADSVVHDNACGTGVVSAAVLAAQEGGPSSAAQVQVHATDLSPAMLRVLAAKPFAARVQTAVMDSTALTFADATFSHSVSNFVLMAMTFPDAEKAAAQLHRTLRPDGVAVVTTWHKTPQEEIVRDLAQRVRPDQPRPKEMPIPEAWKTEEALVKVLVAGGFGRDRITVVHEAADVPVGRWIRLILFSMVKDWSSEEKEVLEKLLDERIASDAAAGRKITLVANLAVARK